MKREKRISTSRMNARQARKDLLTRWVVVLDLITQLERDFECATDDVLTFDEQWDGGVALENAWYQLTHARPQFDMSDTGVTRMRPRELNAMLHAALERGQQRRPVRREASQEAQA